MTVIEIKIKPNEYKILNSNKPYDQRSKYLNEKIIRCNAEEEHNFITYKLGNDCYVAYESDTEEETILDAIIKKGEKDEQH